MTIGKSPPDQFNKSVRALAEALSSILPCHPLPLFTILCTAYCTLYPPYYTYTWHTVHYTLHTLYFILYPAPCTAPHCILYFMCTTLSPPHSILYIVSYTLYSVHGILYIVYCTLHTLHCILYSINCIYFSSIEGAINLNDSRNCTNQIKIVLERFHRQWLTKRWALLSACLVRNCTTAQNWRLTTNAMHSRTQTHTHSGRRLM